MLVRNKTKKELNLFFAWGFLLGILCFLMTFGINMLIPTNDAWIFKADIDLRQHYIGWMAYRNTKLEFPLGMTDLLSYPTAMSIIFSDSIPLLAFVFRLLSPILPETFQYFGIFTILSYALTGAVAARMTCRITDNILFPIVMPVIFIFTMPMLERSCYHTSLTAQWLILLALELWISKIAQESTIRQLITWSAMGALCVLIHIYFLPMIMAIMCASILEKMIKDKMENHKIDFVRPMLLIVMVTVISAGLLAVFGAFRTTTTGEYWVGEFGMNLNSMFNSMGHSIFIPGLSLVSEFQYEGELYLGIGVILGILISIISSIIFTKKVDVKKIVKMPFALSFVALVIVLLLVSVCPMISFGRYIIFNVPYPAPILALFGIFRSNGRFAWPILYLIYLLLVKYMDFILPEAEKKSRMTKYIFMTLICAVALIQIVEYSGWIAEKHDRFFGVSGKQVTDWDEIDFPSEYKHMVSFEDDNPFCMEAAYYAMQNGLSLNRFYFARDIDVLVEEHLREIREDIESKKFDDETIYLFDKESFEKYRNCGLYMYKEDNCVFGVKNALSGYNEITEKELEEVRWR